MPGDNGANLGNLYSPFQQGNSKFAHHTNSFVDLEALVQSTWQSALLVAQMPLELDK
ncbi:hypothetical protein IU436_30370 [Nocardia farcinica]|uniref:hypothetical protein n=1 Tax=Nocardia farcinica TaxID=37329 RepID=UPI001894A19E|nr:hypothetical protein [Nocardia farcinica]MBF6422972.1 hypothetical protein [Nocardia farcinica]MBF6434620.1 hypothetical protein [Nocardia farcinica]MBF6505715.1 hypothetical protein [Nocardia farcinica]